MYNWDTSLLNLMNLAKWERCLWHSEIRKKRKNQFDKDCFKEKYWNRAMCQWQVGKLCKVLNSKKRKIIKSHNKLDTHLWSSFVIYSMYVIIVVVVYCYRMCLGTPVFCSSGFNILFCTRYNGTHFFLFKVGIHSLSSSHN